MKKIIIMFLLCKYAVFSYCWDSPPEYKGELVIPVGQKVHIMDLVGVNSTYSVTTDNGSGKIYIEWIMPNTVRYSCYVTSIGRGFSRMDLTYSNNGTSEKREYYHIRTVDVVDITIPNKLFLCTGDNYIFNPIIHDVGATTTLTWQSTDPQVATVTEEGVLKAISEGKTTIICTAENGVTAQSLVEVKPVKVESVALDESEVELDVGGQIQLVATITPNKANKSLLWSSSNESVAFVDENGKVTGAAPGYCLISCYATDGNGKRASCLIHVKDDGSGINKDTAVGDVNIDGTVDVADIATIISIMAANVRLEKVE